MKNYSEFKIERNPFIFLTLKFIVLVAFIFVLDFSVGKILNYFYFKQESGLQYRTTYAIENTTADVLVFGSSRANHHYHPEVFENRLNLSYHNAGRDGNFILYHSAVLKAVLKRYAPKIVILDIIKGEFKQDQDRYDRLSSLLPYYDRHPEMRPIIQMKSKYENLKLVSNIYPYNSSLLTIAVGNAGFNKKRNSDHHGYVPLMKTYNGPKETESNSSGYEIDPVRVKAYETFIQDCIQSNVKLYIVCTPYYTKPAPADYSLILAKEIAKKNNTIFLDYSKDSIFINNPKLFADTWHLNDAGAKVFTNMFIEKIQRTIESPKEKNASHISSIAKL